MITWEHFIYFALVALLLWIVGAYAAWRNKVEMAYTTTALGLLAFFSFILLMWISLERPPLRTMGETRLWYSFFLPFAGLMVYSRWKYKWILTFSTILSLVFICVNLFKPEIHSKTLMPALQSPWFAPHVIVYMFAYALLGAATVMALYLLFFKKSSPTAEEYDITDNLVSIGFALHDFRHALWCSLGKRGLGTLLGMGPEGDLGSYHVVLLSGLHPLPPYSNAPSATGSMGTADIVCVAPDVLVGHQLSAIGTRQFCTYL